MNNTRKISIVGAGCDLGVNKDGARFGANEIIKQIDEDVTKIILNQDENIIKSNDLNDLAKNLNELNKYNEQLYNIELKLKKDSFVITIGGDHSIAIPSILSSCKEYGDIGLIWIDAHTDFNTFETTITGNLHGLPCAAVNGYKCNQLTSFHNGKFINPKNTVIVGARSIDKEEFVNLKDAGVTIITTEEIEKFGIKKVMEKAVSIASNNSNGFHISFDLDVIDPNDAPGVSVPEEVGISKEEAFDIIDCLLEDHNKITSFDIVEYNPLYDINNKTKNIALNILNKIIKNS